METNISHSESKEIIQAKQLFERGKFEEALLIVKNIEEKEDLTDSDRLSCDLIKSSILIRFGNNEECLKYAEKAYQKSQILGNQLYSFDALLNMTWALVRLGDIDKALYLITQCENILRNLTRISKIDREKMEGYIAFGKAGVCLFKGDSNRGLEYVKRSLELREKRGCKHEIVETLYLIGSFYIFYKIDLDYALHILERCQTLAVEINHPYSNSFIPLNFGLISHKKGDLEEALMYYKQVLPIFEKNNNTFFFVSTLNNMSSVYIELGDFDRALLYIKQSLELAKESGNDWLISGCIGTMIEVLFNKGDIEQAHKYLEQLEKICKKEDNKTMENTYKMSKALLLKASPRIRNRAKAEKIYKQIIKEDMVFSEATIRALLYLCELLLDEIQITNELEILEEIDPLITQLLDIAKNSNSYWILSETYMLQAKLALLTSDINGARRLLTKAQKIAETHEMHRLATKISIEHDNLLKEMKTWERLEESRATLKERFELAKLNDQIARMLKKRPMEVPKISEEDPVTILIITEGGTPLFSHSFIEEKEFESYLFSGFLKTLDYFIKEMFSEGLERANFGQYTLIMKSISPFLICYIFKGDSYYAHQKIKYFIENIRKEDAIWHNLIKFFQINQSIHLKDIPLLESLITEIFINKDAL